MEYIGKTTAQVALRFLVQQGIAAIPKPTHIDRMKENPASPGFDLTPDETRRLESPEIGKNLFGWR